MDSFKVIFIFVITNILESYARLSLEEKLNLLARLLPSDNDVRNSLTENNDYTNHLIRENPKVYILQTRKQSNNDVINSLRKNSDYSNRRMYDFHPGMRSPIIASPTMPSQLPEAEAILPGHTLIRPALGMLKSAVKFPHREPGGERGAGVYGNLASVGMTYGGSLDQVLYTGFRRNNIFNDLNDEPTVLIALLPEREEKPALRYIDYGKRERDRKARQAEENVIKEKQKLRQEHGDLGLEPKFNSDNSYSNENKVKEVKRLLKSLNVNGVTLEFFDIPRLKLQAMERENYHDSVKPYTEMVHRYTRRS